MSESRPTSQIPLHRLLREIYRNYGMFRDYVCSTGNHVIEHGYYIYEDDLTTIKGQELISISFWDLQKGLSDLSPRKAEAFWWNVICDKKQRECADKLGVTTVTIGQYSSAALLQIAQTYFADKVAEGYPL